MSDVSIRVEGKAGRITLTRPQALNALNHPMCSAIDAALVEWAANDAVALVIIDGAGERAFCAGGDIAAMYHQGMAGDYDTGRAFWRDEYRMNTRLAEYPKPIVSFLHGFVMGGGVGLGGHCSHRVVGESSAISMPECGIGFVPDVGGTHLLAQAPGRLGEYLGLTGHRMGAGDAIAAGFADLFIPEADWPAAKTALCATGDPAALEPLAADAPAATLPRPAIDAAFGAADLGAIKAALAEDGGAFAEATLKVLRRNAPLSMAVTLEMIRRLKGGENTIRAALRQEHRVSHRIMQLGDFLEGVRAQIIDKDRSPRWKHAEAPVTPDAVQAMLDPLGEAELVLP